MKDLIDVLIEMYTISPKRKQLMKREMEDFMRFFVAFTETDDKYIHMRTAGLVFIRQNEKQIYQQISCLLYTSPSPRDNRVSRMPSSA